LDEPVNGTLLDDGNSTTTCLIDDDCEDGWDCMEMVEQCCKQNTTCIVFGEFTSSAPASYYNIITAIMSGMVFIITLW
jgi:hypothetical protein